MKGEAWRKKSFSACEARRSSNCRGDAVTKRRFRRGEKGPWAANRGAGDDHDVTPRVPEAEVDAEGDEGGTDGGHES